MVLSESNPYGCFIIYKTSILGHEDSSTSSNSHGCGMEAPRPLFVSRCGQGPWGITTDEQANKLRRCLEEESGDFRVDGGKAEQGGGANSVPSLLPQQQPLMVGGLDLWPCAASAASCSRCRRSALPQEQGTHQLEGRPERTQHQPGDDAASSLTTAPGRALGH